MNTINQVSSNHPYRQNFGMKFKSLESVPKLLMSEFEALENQQITGNLIGDIKESTFKFLGKQYKKVSLSVLDNKTPENKAVNVFSVTKRNTEDAYKKVLAYLNKNEGKTVLEDRWWNDSLDNALSSPELYRVFGLY